MVRIKDESGQMAVEFALVAPVLIVVGLVLFSLTQYFYLSNKFDHVCRQVIVVEGVSPQGDEGQKDIDARVQNLIAEKFKDNKVDIEVTSVYIDSSGNKRNPSDLRIIPFLKKYTCTMSYHPLFSDISAGFISSRSPFTLNKTCEIIVDPYRGGILV